MQIDLTDKVAVVTGGSRGIGAATVKLVAAAGARVAFSYRQNVRAARAVESAVASAGGKALAMRADVSKMAGAKRLIDAAVRLSRGRRFGRIDILVANAGIWNAAHGFL
jgi:3-oxoacyl-[acyl-carrier protein] reductase